MHSPCIGYAFPCVHVHSLMRSTMSIPVRSPMGSRWVPSSVPRTLLWVSPCIFSCAFSTYSPRFPLRFAMRSPYVPQYAAPSIPHGFPPSFPHALAVGFPCISFFVTLSYCAHSPMRSPRVSLFSFCCALPFTARSRYKQPHAFPRRFLVGYLPNVSHASRHLFPCTKPSALPMGPSYLPLVFAVG